MNNKILIGIIIIGGFVGMSLYLSPGSGGAINNGPTHLDNKVSNNVEIGPDEDNRLVATTSKRTYLSIMSEGDGGVPVYCEADADVAATAGEGIKLSTSTSMIYEFTANKGNLYVGSVRCTATASTTVLVQEFVD